MSCNKYQDRRGPSSLSHVFGTQSFNNSASVVLWQVRQKIQCTRLYKRPLISQKLMPGFPATYSAWSSPEGTLYLIKVANVLDKRFFLARSCFGQLESSFHYFRAWHEQKLQNLNGLQPTCCIFKKTLIHFLCCSSLGLIGFFLVQKTHMESFYPTETAIRTDPESAVGKATFSMCHCRVLSPNQVHVCHLALWTFQCHIANVLFFSYLKPSGKAVPSCCVKHSRRGCEFSEILFSLCYFWLE